MRGLNVLLPATAAGAIVLTIILAVRAGHRRPILSAYMVAVVLLVAAGIVTRFVNQPINAEVMTWTTGAIPTGWEAARDTWWQWHIARTLSTILAEIALVAGVVFDR